MLWDLGIILGSDVGQTTTNEVWNQWWDSRRTIFWYKEVLIGTAKHSLKCN